jgi:uncharacterized protein YndB with AHSA1/START domain
VKGAVVLERVYPYPPERVWRALTDRQALAEWLMPNDFQPTVGHKFQFNVGPQWGWRGYVDCVVLEVDVPRRLSYSWEGDPKHPTTALRGYSRRWTRERTCGWSIPASADCGACFSSQSWAVAGRGCYASRFPRPWHGCRSAARRLPTTKGKDAKGSRPQAGCSDRRCSPGIGIGTCQGSAPSAIRVSPSWAWHRPLERVNA